MTHTPVPTRAPEPVRPVEPNNPELFARLRALRKALAAEAQVPAYFIFSDRALLEMAAQRPQNETQFLGINGVGQAKLAKYGGCFLEAIRNFCREH